jgi:hypothetical protein
MWKPEYHAVKRTPSFASLSKFGVDVVGAPYTPRSAWPMSSAKSTRTFGFAEEEAVVAAASSRIDRNIVDGLYFAATAQSRWVGPAHFWDESFQIVIK